MIIYHYSSSRYTVRAQAGRLNEELEQARNCLADMSSSRGSGSLREGSSFNSSSDLLNTSRGSSGGDVRVPRTPGVEQARQQRGQRSGGGSSFDGEPRGGRNGGLEEKEEERSSPRDPVEQGMSSNILGETDSSHGQGGGVWGREASHGEGEEDSGVYMEDMRGFVRREGQRLRESVRTRQTGGGRVRS